MIYQQGILNILIGYVLFEDLITSIIILIMCIKIISKQSVMYQA